jgi:small subunit ribosomal protein S16
MVIDFKEDRVFLWLKQGAQPTDTLRSLLQRTGLWLKWSLLKSGAGEEKIAAELGKWQLLQAEKMQREDAKKARRKVARRKKPVEAPAAPAAAEPESAPAAAKPEPAPPAAPAA